MTNRGGLRETSGGGTIHARLPMLLKTPLHLDLAEIPFELSTSEEGGFVAHIDDFRAP